MKTISMIKKMTFILLLTVTAFSCSKEDDTNTQEDMQEATLLGRWNVVGFETAVLYEFTADKRYTMYSSDGVFESVADVIDSGRSGNDYWYEGSMVIVDLNFGNTVTLTPQFKCNTNVVDWLTANNEVHSTIYREGFDYNSCND